LDEDVPDEIYALIAQLDEIRQNPPEGAKDLENIKLKFDEIEKNVQSVFDAVF